MAITMENAPVCSKCNRRAPDVKIFRAHIRPKFLNRSGENGIRSICRDCEMEEASRQYFDSKALAISKNREPYKSFLEAMYELDAMLLLQVPDRKMGETMARILYATGITAMETYLSDTFINRVLNDDALLRRCVETDPELCNRDLKLGAIFSRQAGLREEVKEYLTSLLFHNLAKINLMYRSVLDVHFPKDLSAVYKAVSTRHDIVHRGGKSKAGKIVPVSAADVRSLIKTLKTFIHTIEEQLLAVPHNSTS